MCLAGQATHAAEISDGLRTRALHELQRAMHEESRWVKVHAGESLVAMGYGGEVREVFNRELQERGEEPQYRVGIWRVMARAAVNNARRDEYIGRIVQAYSSTDSSDQDHALEAAAKLGIPTSTHLEIVEGLAAGSDETAAYARWLLAVDGSPARLHRLAELLDSDSPAVRSVTAYAFRHLARQLPTDLVELITSRARASSPSDDNVYVTTAALVAAHRVRVSEDIKKRVHTYLASIDAGTRIEAAMAFAECGSSSDAAALETLLDDPDPDVKVAACTAILRIDRREPQPFQALDWIVIAAYGAGMLGVGLYFERRTKNAEDFLLGGRAMAPWAVGLSYFAGLFSTISYLAYPGELIRYGPMFLSFVLAYPFVYVVVGRMLIPYIMRLHISSAYEILERRLGLATRMLGASFFLILRLVWMSVIVYATSRSVLVPLMKLEDAATPWVCAVLGIVTVTYTALGGLPAVIWTDVLQTFILFFGAILSIILISVDLGGASAWWPKRWDPTWEPFQFWFDPDARLTVAAAMMSQFVWYICTAGSDQMAIQRYLATKDAASARRMFGTSLIADALVTFLLAALGLALFAYFHAHPSLLPEGSTLANSADSLLPQFIVTGLPAGVSGLVIAGLLAAAMSSLSSGLNSSCAVLTVDWVQRFRPKSTDRGSELKLVRQLSWVVGTIVVILSLAATYVSGNLLEVTNKVVNLLTAPLFVLFFLAMFVPWATQFGALVAAAVSVLVAVAIAYFDFTGLSFIWIMPLSLIFGVLTGCLASLIPIGSARPMLQISASDDGAHLAAPLS